MCLTCERYLLKLKLRSGELLRTPVGDADEINRLCDDIDALNLEYLAHRQRHCYWWLEHRRLDVWSIYAGAN